MCMFDTTKIYYYYFRQMRVADVQSIWLKRFLKARRDVKTEPRLLNQEIDASTEIKPRAHMVPSSTKQEDYP